MPDTTSRNDLITQWALPYTEDYMKTTSLPVNNTFNDFIHIQDDQIPSELLEDSQQPLYQFYPPQRGGSPFHSPVALQFASSPSSASASPIFSSPAFSTIKSPTTAAEFSTSWDGALNEAPSMSASSSRNPSIQIQQSSPSSQPSRPYSSQALSTSSPMLAQHGLASTHGWNNDANMQLLSPVRAHNGVARRTGLHATHKRAQSGSSGVSGGGRSPRTYDQMSGLDSYQNSGNGKSLPTPVQTPVQNSFLAVAFQNGDNAEVERAMRQAVLEHQQQLSHQAEDDTFNYSSLPPSVSSMSHHNSPATPQTSYEDLDDGSKSIAHDFNKPHGNAVSVGLPKLNRTISDIYQDELYNTGIVPSNHARKQQNPASSMLNPYRNMFADRLQAANQGHLSARSQSPSNSISRERSPFRQGSELASALAVSGLPANMQLPHTGMDLGSQQDNQTEPKTISPKDALLEYHETPEDVAMPSLFPTTSSGSNYQMAGETLGLRRDSSSAFHPTQNYSQMESFPNQYAHQAGGLRQPFYVPQTGQQIATHPNPRRQPAASNNLIHQTPEFPASLPSMESSTPSDTKEQIQRPTDTSSDSGTYTCTYHGCTLRFETPAKLQKHKREAHRQTMPGQLAGRDSTNSSLAIRNSQAGPHKCERINPSTGKPCNSIFSRPYDLTRHEDTIHNARKQKVRCHLCQEEKTFSRNDALTRHMRVVHPEVDWPGKQRRKGRD